MWRRSRHDLTHVNTPSCSSTKALDRPAPSSQGGDGADGGDVGVDPAQDLGVGQDRSLTGQGQTHPRLVDPHSPLSEEEEKVRGELEAVNHSPVTVGRPGLLTEPVVEVVRDVGSRLPPGFVLETLHVHLHCRLSIDGQNVIEVLHIELPLLLLVARSEAGVRCAGLLQLKQ